jgi:hypothetical protein
MHADNHLNNPHKIQLSSVAADQQFVFIRFYRRASAFIGGRNKK